MKFHVEHNVRPANVVALLHELSPFVGEVRAQLLDELAAAGHKINPHYLFWSLKVLRSLGLTDYAEKTDAWQLTRRGAYLRALAEWNQPAFHDIMHYLYYASWNFGNQEASGFSWTYQTVSNLLWERRPTIIDGKMLAAEVRELAQKQFEQETVSLTDYAIDGVYNWLRPLSPVFAQTDSKSRRRATNSGRIACSPDLFLLAVDYLYRTGGLPYNRPVFMDDERAAIVCRLCLLDPQKWRLTMVRAVEQFGILRRSTGINGVQVTLERPPRLIVWPGEADTSPVDIDEALAEPVAESDDSLGESDEEDEDDEE